jgi:hypothetical protein
MIDRKCTHKKAPLLASSWIHTSVHRHTLSVVPVAEVANCLSVVDQN